MNWQKGVKWRKFCVKKKVGTSANKTLCTPNQNNQK